MLNLSATDAAAVREFVRGARAALGPALVDLRLFGSKARGDAEPGSDIDIAVVVREAEQRSRDKILDLAFDVSLAHGVYISPRVISVAVLRHPVWRLTGFLQALEREGVTLP